MARSWTWKITDTPVEQRGYRTPELDHKPLYRFVAEDPSGREWQGPIYLSVEDLDALIDAAVLAREMPMGP